MSEGHHAATVHGSHLVRALLPKVHSHDFVLHSADTTWLPWGHSSLKGEGVLEGWVVRPLADWRPAWVRLEEVLVE
jgi:hypothetical protein